MLPLDGDRPSSMPNANPGLQSPQYVHITGWCRSERLYFSLPMRVLRRFISRPPFSSHEQAFLELPWPSSRTPLPCSDHPGSLRQHSAWFNIVVWGSAWCFMQVLGQGYRPKLAFGQSRMANKSNPGQASWSMFARFGGIASSAFASQRWRCASGALMFQLARLAQ
jgi:hypothetical protein